MSIWTSIVTFTNPYGRYIEGALLLLILFATFYLGYHTRSVLDEADKSKQQTKVINSIPQIITKTQTITKVIHDSKDTCAATNISPAILEQLHKQ